MSLFSQIWNYLTKNRRTIITILFALVYIYWSIDNSFAGEGDTPGITNASKDNNWLVLVLNSILKMASMLLWMLTFLIWLFLNPEWTSWSFLGLLDPLKTMWILISNIVYFVFAFLFIWIAFMNIIWKWENYQLKQAIPKFIVWILIVPFSWFIVQFVVSLSNILTITVLTLPYDTFKWTDFFSDEKLESIKFCDRYKFEMWETKVNEKWEIQLPITCIWNQEGVSLKDFVSAEDSKTIYGIISFYTYWVMSLDSQWAIFQQDLKTINNIINLSVKLIFDMIFVLVYLILLVALALALFVRWVMLWLFAMFSPVFWLLYFFKKPWEWFWEWSSKSFNILQMVKLAMVPVYVAWALSFWLLFIFIAWNWIDKAPSDAALKMKNWEASIWKVTFEITDWSIWDQNSPSKKLINWFQNTLWQLLLQLLWLWILWMAVMAALHSSEITNSVTHPIAEFGKSIWDLIKKAPTYAPILPGWISAEWLKRMWTMPGNAIEKTIANKVSPFQEKVDRAFWVETISSRDIANLREKWSTLDASELPEIQGELRKMAGTYWTSDKQFQSLLKEFNDKLKNIEWWKFHKDDKKPIFDNTWKLTDDWVRLLYENQSSSSRSDAQWAINGNYATKVLYKWWDSSHITSTTSPTQPISWVILNNNTVNIPALNSWTSSSINITREAWTWATKLSWTWVNDIISWFKAWKYEKQFTEEQFRKTLKDSLTLHDDDIKNITDELKKEAWFFI